MKEFEKEVVKHLLNNLLKANYFSIYEVEKIIKIAEINYDKDDFESLDTLIHVFYSNMTPKLKNMCFEKTIELFRNVDEDMNKILDEIVEKYIIK